MEHQEPVRDGSIAAGDRPYTFPKKKFWIACSVVLFLFALLWTWKALQIHSLKKDQEAQRSEWNEQFAQRYRAQGADYLKSLAKPYVWALRTELLQGNLAQVNQYNNDLVRQKNFLLIVVADTQGVILSSTDKKYEGKPLSTLQQESYLSIDSAVVSEVNDTTLVMASPIMSFNSKLGTLVIRYRVHTPTFVSQ